MFSQPLGFVALAIASVSYRKLPCSPTECLCCRMIIFYEYSAEKAIEHLKPIKLSEHIHFIKSSEDVCNLFFLLSKGVLQSLNLSFPFEFGILKKMNTLL